MTWAVGPAASVREAFGETVDPARHVARPRTESILEALVAWCDAAGPGSSVAALVAPPGSGKTHLLRVLERRLALAVAPRLGPTLYLPYAALSIEELASWVEGLLAGPRGATASIRAGLEQAARKRSATERSAAPVPTASSPATATAADAGVDALVRLRAMGEAGPGPLCLLIDDADSMPTSTLRAWVQGLPIERSPIKLVLALTDDSRAARMLATLDRLQPFEQHLREPLDEAETGAYLRARLAGAGLDVDLLEGLEASTVRRIHALSGGVPRRIHRVVLALLEPDRAALARALALHPRSETWLGQPLLDPL